MPCTCEVAKAGDFCSGACISMGTVEPSLCPCDHEECIGGKSADHHESQNDSTAARWIIGGVVWIGERWAVPEAKLAPSSPAMSARPGGTGPGAWI